MQPNTSKPMDQSEIVHHRGGTTVVGQDGMLLLQAIQLKAAINLHAKIGMVPTRGVTITGMFQLAHKITTKGPYKRGAHAKAVEDLGVWIDTMKTAMPVRDERT